MSDHSHSTTTDSHSTPAASHDEHAHESFTSHVKPYIAIGVILFIATVITVGLSYCDFDKWFHGHGWNIRIGLAVATVKVCLVGAYFMHLKAEKGSIWKPLLFTFFFCLALFALFMLAYSDPIPTTSFLSH
jgi:caa(3)-type oxidase subunit IV